MSVLTPTFQPARKPGQISVAILALGAAIALLYFGRVLLVTLVVAVILAFLLEPLVGLAMKLRLPRGLASFLVCSFALLVLYLAGLGLYTEALQLVDDLPAYGKRINELVDEAAARIEQVEKTTVETLIPQRFQQQQAPPAAPQPEEPKNTRSKKRRNPEPPPSPPSPPAIQEVRVRPEPTPLLTYLYSYFTSFYSVLLMASFVPFLVYFMLSWRDHLRRSFMSMFEGMDRTVAGSIWHGVADMARAYVLGNFVLGVIVSVASASFFALVKVPYPLLVGPMSGFLSLVPYVGLPLAIIPPAVAALPVYREPAMYLFIGVVVALFHLLALNLLYPKIVGSRVHLNPLAVTIALMFWGTIWGGIGLLLAIPITAAVKAVCDNVDRLQPYGKLLGD